MVGIKMIKPTIRTRYQAFDKTKWHKSYINNLPLPHIRKYFEAEIYEFEDEGRKWPVLLEFEYTDAKPETVILHMQDWEDQIPIPVDRLDTLVEAVLAAQNEIRKEYGY
jgi:hypothetical protein